MKVITRVECINSITHDGTAGSIWGTGITCRTDKRTRNKRMRAVEDMSFHFSLLAGTQPSISSLWGMNRAIRMGIKVGKGNSLCVLMSSW